MASPTPPENAKNILHGRMEHKETWRAKEEMNATLGREFKYNGSRKVVVRVEVYG